MVTGVDLGLEAVFPLRIIALKYSKVIFMFTNTIEIKFIEYYIHVTMKSCKKS